MVPSSIVRGRLVAGSLALPGVSLALLAVLQHLGCEVAFPTHLDAGAGCTASSDTSSDPANCGVCGNACNGVSCYRGMCGGRQVTQVSAGLHACAVVAAGTVFCWGSNEFGETGSAPTTQTCGSNSACIPTPTEVAGLLDVVEVRAGTYSTCARKHDGTVWCWGRNQEGQLGHAPSSMDNFVPQQVMGVTQAKAIDVGLLFACALDISGALKCWGDDTYDELGTDLEAGSTSMPTAVSLPVATSVSTGFDRHACVVLQPGQVACWGENLLGSLGHDPAMDPSCPPTLVPCQPAPFDVSGVAGASAVRAGNGVTCALLDGGAVSCWGDDGLGQFGDGVDGGAGGFRPVRAAGGLTFVELDERYDFALAREATGNVWAWGSSSRGALGDDAITGVACDNDAARCVPTPTQVHLQLPPGVTITQVSAGNEFGLALDSTGAVWAWGANVDGRLGHLPGDPDAGDLTTCGAGTEICNPTPSPVPGFP